MIAARCSKCNTIGSCLCNFGKSFQKEDENIKNLEKPTIPEFQLSAKEKETAEKFLIKTKKKYGSYGYITYKFIETGIGCCIKIKSSHKDKWADITDLDNW